MPPSAPAYGDRMADPHAPHRSEPVAPSLEREVRREIDAAERPDRPIRRWLRGIRGWIDRHPRLRVAYRLGVGVLGGVIAVAGLALVPLPGPGWLVVFLGLAILGTEFAWARRLARWVKRMLDRFWAWWRARRAARDLARQG
ncbi:hypothetical protein GCM10009819_09570 [Agromyces tropicus]|uniref:TIGR02611 family protein n=2 Tax=Agromyces tropicus TaxID=555371 RepID=A0ABN2U4B8_9MICO